ncbi:glycosyltransferase family 1 protein [Sporolactobacillus sp. THM7-4]|nr:glycosyltransferase family 1 protein [Sporolactobacillus sp. THM7-4]
MKKLLVVGDFSIGSGLTNYIMNTFSKMDQNEIKIDVVNISGSHEMEDKINTLGWMMYHVSPANKGLIRHLSDWRKILRENASKYDAIHFNLSSLWNFIPIIYARRYGISNIVIHAHNNYFSNVSSKRLIMFVLGILHNIGKVIAQKYGTAFFACSEAAGKWLYTEKLHKQKRVKILKNGVDAQKYTYNPTIRHFLREKMGINNRFVVGFIGAFEKRKNPLFLIQVFKEISQKNKQAILLLIGRGSLEKEMKNEVKKNGIEGKVNFLGLRKNVNELLQVMDVFVFPSITEGLGIVLVEAQAAGLMCFPSDQVPNEAKCTDLFRCIPLDESASYWSDQILRYGVTYKRENQSEKLKDFGYDLNDTTKYLETFYTQL